MTALRDWGLLLSLLVVYMHGPCISTTTRISNCAPYSPIVNIKTKTDESMIFLSFILHYISIIFRVSIVHSLRLDSFLTFFRMISDYYRIAIQFHGRNRERRSKIH